MDEFYYGDNIPEIFRIADECILNNEEDKSKKKRKKSKDKDKKKDKNVEKKETSKKDKKDKDKDKKDKKDKKESKGKKSRKEYEIEIIQTIANMEYITRKLEELDPGKRKDAIKIAALNVELRNLQENLNRLKIESGINISELDIGTKFGRFCLRFKSTMKRIKKKCKKFFKHNQDLVIGIIAITAPVLTTVLLKSVLHI